MIQSDKSFDIRSKQSQIGDNIPLYQGPEKNQSNSITFCIHSVRNYLTLGILHNNLTRFVIWLLCDWNLNVLLYDIMYATDQFRQRVLDGWTHLAANGERIGNFHRHNTKFPGKLQIEFLG